MPQAARLKPSFDAGNYRAPIIFDFYGRGWNIPSDVSILSATVVCSAASGSDPTAANRVIGAVSIASRLSVSQLFGDAVDGVDYLLICTAVFSDGVPREPIWVHVLAKNPA